MTDIGVANGSIIFRGHQANNPDNPTLRWSADYTLSHFREELVLDICGFPEYDDPPASIAGRLAKPAPQPSEFETEHILVQGEHKRNCVVYHKEGRGQVQVRLDLGGGHGLYS